MNDTEATTNDIKHSYKLYIKPDVYSKLLWYVDNCEYEISGLCDVEYNESRDAFEVNKVYLVKQEVTATSTVMDEDALCDLYTDLVRQGHNIMPRLWWHSHAKMGVFWSGTDIATMQSDELRRPDFTVALEFNHKHEILCRILVWKPFRIVIDDVRVVVDLSESDNEELEEEYNQKVSHYTFRSNNYSYSSNFGDDESWKGHNKTKTNLDTIFVKNQNNLFKKKILCELPRTRQAALEKIKKEKLHPKWDEDQKDFLWPDPIKNVYWIDRHDVLKDEDVVDNWDLPKENKN